MDQAISFAVAEVHFARALLESEAIPAYLGSEHVVAAWWPMSMDVGCFRLQVRREHLDQARAVLKLRDVGAL